MKKILSWLLTAIMVFSILPMVVVRDAAAAAELVVTGGTYYYDGHEHDVTVEVKDGTGYAIEYSTDNGENWGPESPKLTDPGKLVVSVRARKGTELLTHAPVILEVTEAPAEGTAIKIIAHESETKTPVYKSASDSSEKLGEFSAGDVVTLVSISGDWYKVTDGTITGFVFYWFVKINPDPGPGGTPDLSKVKITATGGTYIYDGKEHKVVATMTDGDGFTLEYSLDNGKNWTTKAPGLTAPGKITVSIQATSTAGIKTHPDVVLQVLASVPSGTAVKIKAHDKNTTAPFRKEPKSGSTKLGSIAAGMEVVYLGKTGDWIKIEFGGKEGYVYYWFVDLDNLDFKPTITTQPESITVIMGKTATFKVIAKGEGTLSYRWQTYESGSWKNVTSGGTSPSYSFTATAADDGKKVRCIVSDSLGSKTSREAVLTVITTAPVITKDLAGTVGVVDGKTMTLAIAAEGVESYQWYYQEPGSSDWITGTSASAHTASLTAKITTEHDGFKFYCKLTNALGTTDSAVVTLSVVKNKAKITKQPVKLTVVEGDTAVFSITATGDALSYQWWVKKHGGKWTEATNASAKTPTYSDTVSYADNKSSYRCVVQNARGKVTSKTVKLTVKGLAATITTQPADTSAPVGGTATFDVTANGTGTLTYQWYYQKAGSKSWKTVSKAKAATLTVTKLTAKMNGYKYRCKITNNGTEIYSDTATLTVY